MKKVLIVTYYWPPSGGGGVQRWLYFVKYLREFGWEPVVFTPANPDFEIRDETLLGEIPPRVVVIRRPIWEPYAIYRKLFGRHARRQQGVVLRQSGSWASRLAVWLRGNFFIPDARIFWVRPAVAYLSRYLRQEKVDALVTTGPPHSLHLIGLELKKRTGIKWLADFRDPWSEWDVNEQLSPGRRAREAQRKLEYRVLTTADTVLTVSPTLQQALIRLGGKRVEMITNGYDLELPATAALTGRFRLAHVGLLNRHRNPEKLWQLLEARCASDPGFAGSLEVHLAGTVEQEVLDGLQQYPHLYKKVVFRGYLNHSEALELYAGSYLLLLLVNNTDNGRWVLPGKMYEYMACQRPILALGPADSDASRILQTAGFDPCLDYENRQAIGERLDRAWDDFRAGRLPEAGREVEQFHRKQLTGSLATCLARL